MEKRSQVRYWVLDFFFMQVPIPEVSHQLSIRFVDNHSHAMSTLMIPVFNYYNNPCLRYGAKFFYEFDLEDVFLNQYYLVET